MAVMLRKSIIRIVVEADDESLLKAICDKRGMTQISLASRMVKWLARQDAQIQSDVLNSESGDSSKSLNLVRKLASFSQPGVKDVSTNQRKKKAVRPDRTESTN